MHDSPLLFFLYVFGTDTFLGLLGYMTWKHAIKGISTGNIRDINVTRNRKIEPVKYWYSVSIYMMGSLLFFAIVVLLLYVYVIEFVHQGTFPVAPLTFK